MFPICWWRAVSVMMTSSAVSSSNRLRVVVPYVQCMCLGAPWVSRRFVDGATACVGLIVCGVPRPDASRHFARWLLPQADRCRAITQAIRSAVVPKSDSPTWGIAISVFQTDWWRGIFVIAKFPTVLHSHHSSVFLPWVRRMRRDVPPASRRSVYE